MREEALSLRRQAVNVRRVLNALLIAGLGLGLAGMPAAGAQERPQSASLPSQNTTTVGPGAISSNFVTQARYGEAADDFNLATTGSNNFWIISRVDVRGSRTSFPTIDSVSIRFYTNAQNALGHNVPGNLYAITTVPYSSVTVTGPGLEVNLSIPVSIGLTANNTDRKYWLSVVTNLSNTDTGLYWSWSSHDATGGTGTEPSAWINSGIQDLCDGSWNRRVEICGIQGGDKTDMAFALTGSQVFLQYFVYMPVIRR